MDSTDNDEGLAFDGVADPFFDIDCDPMAQTGSDWYALALSASLGGKALHGFTFATTSETIGKTTYEYAEKHTVGWIRTNDVEMNVEHPGDEWDEITRPTKLHTGVKTGAQLSLMFDTNTWESSSAQRARNTAFLAAGLVTHGTPMSEALETAGKVSGEPVQENAVMNTIVPVSHLKREAAGVAKASHAIFSRMNAQRYISWVDTQLHEGILPYNAAIDWAKITVVGRYIAEANMRYDPRFTEVARLAGVPYTIVRGSWAYVSNGDYLLRSEKWKDVPSVKSELIAEGMLEDAYSTHTDRLTTQIMRTYNELASDERTTDLESILQLAETLRSRRSTKTRSIAPSTDVLSGTTTHSQSAAVAASYTATSGTSHNAIVQAFREIALTDRNLRERASNIAAQRRRLHDIEGELTPFYPFLASRHTWIRALEVLDSVLGNPRTALDRINKLHRSMTQTSTTIATDVPITSSTRHAMGPHIVDLIKKGLVSKGPTAALPRYATSFKASVERGTHARLLRAVGDHLTEYKEGWAKRYEDWARVYALAKNQTRNSVLYGGASLAFRSITIPTLLSRESGFIDGANVRTSYLYKMAEGYARKRRLAKPTVPTTHVGTARMYAEILDTQYNADVPFADVVEFVEPRIAMFADDLEMEIEPMVPDDDAPGDDVVEADEVDSVDSEEERLNALMEEMMGEETDAYVVTESMVLSSYPRDVDADAVAEANGYSSFSAAYAEIGDKARWDLEGEFSQTYVRASTSSRVADEEDGIAIA